jgi:hypothetical protein
MDPLAALAECKKAFESLDQKLLEAREYEACKILDRLFLKTTYVARQNAANALLFAFKKGDISERVFDRYWTQLNGYEVAA